MRNKKIIALALALVCYFSGSSQVIYSYQNWADGGAFGARIILPHDSTTQGSKTPKSDVLFIGNSMYTLGSDGHYHLLTGGASSQVQADYAEADNTQVDYIKNKPSISAVGLSGQWLSILNRPIVVRQDSLPYSYPTWLSSIAWQTLATSPDSTTYGYHTYGYYAAKFKDSALWKFDAQYLASHNLTMHDFTQMLSMDGSGFADPARKVIVFIGTSITHGIQDTTSDTTNRWTDRVIEQLYPYGQFTEINLGVPGHTIDESFTLIPTKTSSMVKLVIEFGSNELNDAIDSATYRANLNTFIGDAVAKGWAYSDMLILSQQGSQLNACGSTAQQLGFNFVDTTTAVQYGISYVDLWNPLLLPQYQYLWDPTVANIHPPVDAVQLFADIVGGALSRQLQYQNMTQQLFGKDTSQFGALVIKNAHYIATPRLLATDGKGNVGYASQLPANIRTQGTTYFGGGIVGMGRLGGLQNITIPSDWDSTKDWLMPYQGKIVQFAQTAVPYTTTFQPMYSDGNTYFTNNNPSGVINIVASGLLLQGYPNGITTQGPITLNNGGINAQNQIIQGSYGGHHNYFTVAENGTYDMVYSIQAPLGQHEFQIANGTDGNFSGAMTIRPDGSMIVEFTNAGDSLTEDYSSAFTVSSGVYNTKGSQPVPRLTTTARNAISSPTEGLQVYDTDLHENMVYNGSAWMPIAGATATYLPTMGTNTNVSSAVPDSAIWTLDGATVTVYGSINVTPTTGTTVTTVNINAPFVSAWSGHNLLGSFTTGIGGFGVAGGGNIVPNGAVPGQLSLIYQSATTTGTITLDYNYRYTMQ